MIDKSMYDRAKKIIAAHVTWFREKRIKALHVVLAVSATFLAALLIGIHAGSPRHSRGCVLPLLPRLPAPHKVAPAERIVLQFQHTPHSVAPIPPSLRRAPERLSRQLTHNPPRSFSFALRRARLEALPTCKDIRNPIFTERGLRYLPDCNSTFIRRAESYGSGPGRVLADRPLSSRCHSAPFSLCWCRKPRAPLKLNPALINRAHEC